MNPLVQLLRLEDVLLDVYAADRTRLLERVATHLATRHGLPSDAVFDSLVAREALGSTAVGRGMAIPHARMGQCAEPGAMLVRTREPIPFDAPDRRPVSIFLGLIVPQRGGDRHLEVLATAASMFSDRGFRQRLKSCVDANACHALIAAWPTADAADAAHAVDAAHATDATAVDSSERR